MTSRQFSIIAPFLACVAATAAAQQSPVLPFQPGERLEFAVHLSRMGASGHGAIWIDARDTVRGVPTWTIHSDSRASVAFISGSDRAISWLDPVKMTSLRYVKREKRVFSSHVDSIEINSEEHRWSGANGVTGETTTDTPLDELSFIYFVRTLRFAGDSAVTFNRNYDAARNPTSVRLVGRETIETKAGPFQTLIVEVTTRDPRHYKGEGLMRINLSDDARRIPVRVESTAPEFGTMLLTLERVTVQGILAAAAGVP